MAILFAGRGAAQPKPREYLFVDGGCLRSSVRKMCQDIFGDEHAYQPYLPGMIVGYDKVFYYDAVSGKEHGEAQPAYEARVQPEHDRFARIQALDRVHVSLGKIVGTGRRQKGVDVKLAVDMMTQAFRGNTSRVTLLAGDADFEPLVRALVGEGMDVTLWHPPQASSDLKGAADVTRLLSFAGQPGCLTRDGNQQAFQPRSIGSGGVPPAAKPVGTTSDGAAVSGHWMEDCLKVWRSRYPFSNGEYCELAAPGSSLKNALLAFDALYGWSLVSSGEEWIETR